MDLRPLHMAPVAQDQSPLLPDAYPQGVQAAQVQINGPVADLAAPGIGAYRPPKTGQKGPQHKDGGTDLLGYALGHGVGGGGRHIQPQRPIRFPAVIRPQLPQDG